MEEIGQLRENVKFAFCSIPVRIIANTPEILSARTSSRTIQRPTVCNIYNKPVSESKCTNPAKTPQTFLRFTRCSAPYAECSCVQVMLYRARPSRRWPAYNLWCGVACEDTRGTESLFSNSPAIRRPSTPATTIPPAPRSNMARLLCCIVRYEYTNTPYKTMQTLTFF